MKQEHMTALEYREMLKKPRKSKYNAKKTKVDGITFDSLKESKRYEELKILERTGKIKNLKLQPKFELQKSFIKNGKKYRAINYIADFSYIDTKTNKKIVEDVKSKATKTEVYKIKKKMFEKKYRNLRIKES